MIRYRIIMLAYIASPEIRLMTRAAIERVLQSTGEDAGLTVGINGGESFPVPANQRLTMAYWAERKGLGHAYNDLALICPEPFLVFLHNDCFVPDDVIWLEKLAAVAAAYGFAFPAVKEDREESLLRGITPTYDKCPPSCCYVVRRDVFGRLGGFDRIFEGCHFEDLDLFMRGQQLGCTMARVKDVEVFHRRGMTRGAMSEEANAAFRRNAQTYQARWGGIDRLKVPGTVDVGLPELLGGEHGGLGNGADSAPGSNGKTLH